MTTPRLFTLDVTLLATERKTLPLNGEFLYVLEATGAFNVYLNQEYRARLEKGLKYRVPPGEKFTVIDIEDVSGAGNTLRLAYGAGDFDDNRLTLVAGAALALDAATIASLKAKATVLGDAADVTLGAAAATAILALDATRRRATIVSDPANTVSIRIGSQANVGAARGALIQPGQSIDVIATAAIWGYAAIAGQKVSIMYEAD